MLAFRHPQWPTTKRRRPFEKGCKSMNAHFTNLHQRTVMERLNTQSFTNPQVRRFPERIFGV